MHEELSRRQEQVVSHVADGKTNRQIALEMGLAESTVKDHIEKACQKAGVDNRTALAMWWVRQQTAK